MSTKLVSKLVVTNGLVQAGGTTVDSSADGQALIRDAGALVFRALTTADVSGSVSITAGDLRYQERDEKGVANGYCPLDAGNLVPNAYLPPLAITNTFVVADQAAMLALTAQTGDVAIRSDLNKTFILAADPASTLGNWKEMLTPTDAVLSVNGQTGVVVLSAGNVGAQPADADLTSLAGASGTNTIYYRSAPDTWSAVTVGTGLTFSGGNLGVTAGTYQPLDGDLTAISALTGTNTIYYRSAADTWTPVTVGSGLSFTAGTLAASGANFTVTDTSTIDMTLAGSVLSASTIGFNGTMGD